MVLKKTTTRFFDLKTQYCFWMDSPKKLSNQKSMWTFLLPIEMSPIGITITEVSIIQGGDTA